jgi:hypothetical protein
MQSSQMMIGSDEYLPVPRESPQIAHWFHALSGILASGVEVASWKPPHSNEIGGNITKRSTEYLGKYEYRFETRAWWLYSLRRSF